MATENVAPKEKRNGKKKALLIVTLIIVLAVSLFASRLFMSEEEIDVAALAVKQGEFVISLELKNGELEAIDAEHIIAPRVRGELKIVELFPEGKQAAIGDLLVQFEETEFQKRLADREQQLETAQAELEKEQAQQKANIFGLEADIEDQTANLRLAELQVERMKFEAMIEKEKAEISAIQAQLNHKKATQKLESETIVNNAEVRKRELEIARAQRELKKAQKEFKSLRVVAEKPGLVVYGKVWKGDGPEKIRVGDNVWGGVKVLALPDLSRMQVKTFVNEVDVDKLSVGQRVLIKLDALPEPTFHGAITTIAALGREKEGEKNVKVFDITLTIEEEDSRLKPGMSATSTVIVETIPPRPEAKPDSVINEVDVEIAVVSEPLPLYIPLDAVFVSNGQSVVYLLKDGVPVEQVVTLGKKNENYVIIEDGLGPDDRITLQNPASATNDIGGLAAEGSSTPQGSATE